MERFKTPPPQKHEFYCEICGELYKITESWPSGYYADPVTIHQIFIDNVQYKAKHHFCKKCKSEFNKRLLESLIEFDFNEVEK